MRTRLREASLWVDGRFIGPIGGLAGGFAVRGRQAPPFWAARRRRLGFSHYQELDLAPRQRLELDIELAPVLP
ncbi:MAG: hypothetical protein HS111_16750 [Kofleriaceae bacterium]|nr:hypothetical protein [Kofleriaceae bacterium]